MFGFDIEYLVLAFLIIIAYRFIVQAALTGRLPWDKSE